MQSMRAVTLKAFGNSDMMQLSRVPRATITSPDSVLIKVMAAGVNLEDVLQRRGYVRAPRGCSEVMGLEVSGFVAEVGSDVKNVKEGDKVMALLCGGGYADFATAPAGCVMPMPADYSFIEAAAVPVAFLKSWHCLRYQANVQPGQRVLIHDGATGLGLTMAQLTEKFFKATPITTSTREKLDTCRMFSRNCIDVTPDEAGLFFAPKFKALLGEDGVHAVIEPNFGGSYMAENAAVLEDDARIVVVGFQSGSETHLNCRPLFRQRAQILFSRLRFEDVAYRTELVRSFVEEVMPLLKDRVVRPVTNKTFPVQDVAQAHDRLEEGAWGKTVLSVNSPFSKSR